MRRVLVTGASGCIGRHVLPRLVERGWDVCAVSSRSLPDGPPVRWRRVDLVSSEAMVPVLAGLQADAPPPSCLVHRSRTLGIRRRELRVGRRQYAAASRRSPSVEGDGSSLPGPASNTTGATGTAPKMARHAVRTRPTACVNMPCSC